MAQPPASSRRAAPALPPEPTPFVGRETDVSRIALLTERARLVTICGPPGVGKTRVALQVAATVSAPAWYCDLSAATTTVDLCSSVARAFGLTLDGDGVSAIGTRLARHGATMVVLDNCERLVEVASAAISQWLEAAPAMRVIVTSRERLRLRQEQVVELSPLPVPTEDSDVEASEAVQLFIDRATAHRPDFAPSQEDKGMIGHIVRALEGNPLAIELAAARVDALGVRGLHKRIHEQLELLSRGGRGPRRQATLRDAIDASWRLLDETQQHALACMAMFRGGFSLEAAEAVVGDHALDTIEDLRDRSLLRSAGDGRFTLYESIREFALEQLIELGAEGATTERHAAFYLTYGEKHAERFNREGTPAEALASERDNLLAVFERALANDQRRNATRAVLALGPVLSTRGPAKFHLELLERVTSESVDDPDLLHARGLAKRTVADLDGAEADLLAGLDLVHAGFRYACMRKDLGVLYHQRRRIDQARACYESALLSARSLDDGRLEGVITHNLGALEHDLGRFEEADRLYREALDRIRSVGDTRLEGICWTNFGVLEQEEGRHRSARKHYERALTLLADTPDHRFEAIALGNLGLLEHESGNLAEARERHEQALSLLLEVGDARSEAWCRARLGAVLATDGDLDAADAQLDEAERLVVGRDPLGLELVRLHRCFLEVASGDRDRATKRLEEARARRGDEPPLVEVNDDARMVLRILAPLLQEGAATTLEIGPNASWFRPPGGSTQSLEKYAAARNILERLTTERLGDGGAVPAGALFAAGWPGVTITPQSANNRLYVQLAKLRKMGLKMLLRRTEQGYELDPSTPVARVAEASVLR